jgi:phosphatidylserine/phosphatidylglycerophosphate/cardiolipin synthase-like enzyme
MSRGVKLRIVQESRPVADSCQIFEPATPEDTPKCRERKGFVQQVRSRGGAYVPFDKKLCGPADTRGYCFQHGKIMMVDSNLVSISTGNLDPSNLCDLSENPSKCNRDYTVVSRDPAVVKSIKQVFEGDLAGRIQNIPALLGKKPRVTVSPYSLVPLVGFVDSARKTIQIENQYLKNPDLNAALIRAAQRGVKVFVMVSSACTFGRPDERAIEYWTQIYSAFDAAGIHTKTFNSSIPIGGHPGYLHAKAILVDGIRAWVGSVNGSTTSISTNREYGIFSNDPELVRTLGTYLYSDFTASGAESWQDSLRCKMDHGASSPISD